MTITAAQRMELAQEHELRIKYILDMSSCVATCAFESPQDQLEDLADELQEGYRPKSCDPSMKPLYDLYTKAGECFDQFGWLLGQGEPGYVAQISTPIRQDVDEDGSCHFSWSRAYLQTIYAPTIEELWEVAIKWAKLRASQDAAKPKRKG